MHWADVAAERLLRRGEEHLIATGITPSGHIHVGNMREILTGDMVARAVRDAGGDASLVYISDTFDPLRKVYPFLDREVYSEHVGRPLSEIPCPCGEHENYAEHFLEPFLSAMDDLGIEHRVLYVHEMYRDGKYADVVRRAMDSRDLIRDILSSVSGRDLPEDWWPYTVKCESCGRMGGARITGYSWPNASYVCECGYEGEVDLRYDGGKLPWRVEWPARWKLLGVTFEPFGKDHAAAGGSYDTGSRIIREVYGAEPPDYVVYEWIHLKGQGAMSSSRGVVFTAVDMLSITPPEAMRFLIARNQPSRHIEFDPGFGIISLMDEYEHYERVFFGVDQPLPSEEDRVEDMKRTYVLSQPRGIPPKVPCPVPYRHLATLVQIYGQWDELLDRVKRTYPDVDLSEEFLEVFMDRAERVRIWVERYAPPNARFSVAEHPPPVSLSGEEKKALIGIYEAFVEMPEWKAEGIHNKIYEVSRARGVSPKKVFRTLYRIFLDQDRGPRVGFFFESLGRDRVLERLSYYVSGAEGGDAAENGERAGSAGGSADEKAWEEDESGSGGSVGGGC